MVSILLVLLAVILFITGQFVGGIVLIVLAFLSSPFGVPAIAGHPAGAVYAAKDTLAGLSPVKLDIRWIASSGGR